MVINVLSWVIQKNVEIYMHKKSVTHLYYMNIKKNHEIQIFKLKKTYHLMLKKISQFESHQEANAYYLKLN